MGTASAEPLALHLEAELWADGQTISGTVMPVEGDPVPWRDALEPLPNPTHELDVMRTWAGLPHRGHLRLAPHSHSPAKVAFQTRLPRRRGDVGATRHGVFANGRWHPHPDVPEASTTRWHVTLKVPEGWACAIGDHVGTDELKVSVDGPFVSLACVPDGEVQHVRGPGFDIRLLTAGPARRALMDNLAKNLALLEMSHWRWRGVAVEAPLRRRLARAGHGLVYLSDRAWRVFPWFQHLHHKGVMRQASLSWMPPARPVVRQLSAAAVLDLQTQRMKKHNRTRWFGWLTFIPLVDTALYNREMAFQQALFDRPYRMDRVPDGPDERATGDTKTGEAIYRQLEHAPSNLQAMLIGAVGSPQGAAVAGSAPLTIGQPRLDTLLYTPPRPTAESAEPAPWRWTLAGQISSINLGEGFISAFLATSVRRADDTRNLFSTSLSTTQRNHLRLRTAYRRSFGPLMRGTTRSHSVTVGADFAWLNPNFATLSGPPVAAGGSLRWGWSNRRYSLFPLRGSALFASVAAGSQFAAGEPYASVQVGGNSVAAPHPRVALAASVRMGRAFTTLPQRLLAMGGPSGIRGLPDDAVQADQLGVAQLELRLVPIRGASVPLGVMWATDLQFTLGLDAAVGARDSDRLAALGAVVGAATVVEHLGLAPAAAHVTLGWPLWTEGVERPTKNLPFEVLLGWSQSF